MRFNNEPEPYLNTLRESEIYPPFREIEELVFSHEPRSRRFAWFAWPVVESALVALVAIATLWQIAPSATDRSGNVSVANSMSAPFASRTNSASSSQIANSATVLVGTTTLRHAIAAHNRAAIPELQAIIPHQGTEQEAMPKNSAATNNSTIPTHNNIPKNILSSSGLAGARNSQTQETKMWTAFISGSPLITTMGTQNNITFGTSLGMRYRMNNASSLVLELRRNVFMMSSTDVASTVHDSSVSLDDQTYREALGASNSTVIHSNTSVVSLDFGYRYELMPQSIVSPFAEVLVGGSTSGALTSEIAGVQYKISSALLLNLAARGDQLYRSRATPERAFAFEAGVGFAW